MKNHKSRAVVLAVLALAIVLSAALVAAVLVVSPRVQSETLQSWTNSSATLASGVSSVAALVAAALFVLTWRERRLHQQIGVLEFRLHYYDAMRAWADEVIQTISEAVHLCDMDPRKPEGETFFNRQTALRAKLSALVDSGRWFFPNWHQDKVGSHKESGYQGRRWRILDPIVRAYELASKLDTLDQHPNQELREKLVRQQRLFVGYVQIALETREFSHFLKQIRLEFPENPADDAPESGRPVP